MQKNIVILLLFMISMTTYSQDDHWQIKLNNGESLTNVVFYTFENDTLALLNSGPLLMIPIQDIVELRNSVAEKKRTIGIIARWIGIGVVTGAITALLTDSSSGSSYSFGPAFVALAGGGFGGLVGVVIGTYKYSNPVVDQVHNFDSMSEREKARVLSRIVQRSKY